MSVFGRGKGAGEVQPPNRAAEPNRQVEIRASGNTAHDDVLRSPTDPMKQLAASKYYAELGQLPQALASAFLALEWAHKATVNQKDAIYAHVVDSLVKVGGLGVATSLGEAMVAAGGHFPATWLRISQANAKRKDYQKALENVDRALAAQPQFATALRHRSAVLKLMGKA